LQDKREFYSRPEVAAAYDEQRFGGLSGRRVNQRELEIALGFIPTQGRTLDLASGTGRLTRALLDRGQDVMALDASPSMAARTRAMGAPTAIGDAFHTPFRNNSFDNLASIRFAFHCPDLEPLLAEMRRLVVDGGPLTLDTYVWSPRSALALGSGRWGSRVYTHSRHEVASVAARLGLRIEAQEPCFLFSPYVYRLAPLPLEQAFEALERRVPDSWLCRVFWKLRS
jgi:SAM-dependent methyltransferase